MASDYVIQIVHIPTGKVARSWAPGLAVEKQFVDEIIDRVQQKGVGVFRTEAHVLADVQEAITELLYDLKAQV